MAEKREKFSGATLTGFIIVNPKEHGGEIRMLVEGRTFVISGGLKRGLLDVAKAKQLGLPE